MLDFSNSSFYPNSQDIAAAEDKLKYLNTRASLESYNVKIFDMSKDSDIEEYTKLMKVLLDGIMKKTHYIWAKERTLINDTWKIYLEWSVYSINK